MTGPGFKPPRSIHVEQRPPDALARDLDVSLRADLVRVIRESLGLPETVAVPMADELARGLQQLMGGLYVPARELRETRDAAVRREFNGRNHDDIMRRHDISRATLYRIIGTRPAGAPGASCLKTRGNETGDPAA